MITKDQFVNSYRNEVNRREIANAITALQNALGCKIQLTWKVDHIEIIYDGEFTTKQSQKEKKCQV